MVVVYQATSTTLKWRNSRIFADWCSQHLASWNVVVQLQRPQARFVGRGFYHYPICFLGTLVFFSSCAN